MDEEALRKKIQEFKETGQPKFKDPQEAFNQAIKEGRLSDKEGDPNYAGDYMYMGTWLQNGYDIANNIEVSYWKDLFKHILTREYIK